MASVSQRLLYGSLVCVTRFLWLKIFPSQSECLVKLKELLHPLENPRLNSPLWLSVNVSALFHVSVRCPLFTMMFVAFLLLLSY